MTTSNHGYGKNWDPKTAYQDTNVARKYDAERFSSLAGRVYVSLERRAILSAFGELPAGARIADIPCGTGRLAEVLLHAGYKVTGFDISDQMLEVARTRLRQFGNRFDGGIRDALKSTDVEPTFDGVLCARVLMHFPLDEQVQFLRGAAALTQGPVVFTQSYTSRYQRLRRRVKHVLGHLRPAFFPLSDIDLQDLIRRAGLREKRRLRLMPLVSEAMVVVCEKA